MGLPKPSPCWSLLFWNTQDQVTCIILVYDTPIVSYTLVVFMWMECPSHSGALPEIRFVRGWLVGLFFCNRSVVSPSNFSPCKERSSSYCTWSFMREIVQALAFLSKLQIPMYSNVHVRWCDVRWREWPRVTAQVGADRMSHLRAFSGCVRSIGNSPKGPIAHPIDCMDPQKQFHRWKWPHKGWREGPLGVWLTVDLTSKPLNSVRRKEQTVSGRLQSLRDSIFHH